VAASMSTGFTATGSAYGKGGSVTPPVALPLRRPEGRRRHQFRHDQVECRAAGLLLGTSTVRIHSVSEHERKAQILA
jgi:hypothetical protein